MGVVAVEIADKSISNTWRRRRPSNSPLTGLLQLAQWRHLWPNVTSRGDWLNFWTVSTVAGDERRTDRTNEQIENWTMFQRRHSLIFDLLVCPIRPALQRRGGSAAEWLACWTPAQKGPGSNRVATLSLANCSHTSCLCSPSSKIGSSPLKGCGGNCRPGGKWWQPTARFMTHITCRLTAKNRDQLRNPTLGNRVWATFTFFLQRRIWYSLLLRQIYQLHYFICENRSSLAITLFPSFQPHCEHKPHRRRESIRPFISRWILASLTKTRLEKRCIILHQSSSVASYADR